MVTRLRSLFSSSNPSRLISFLPSSQKSQLSSLISPLPKPTTLPLPFYPRIEGSFLTHFFSTGSFGSIPAKTQTPSLGFPRSRLYHSDSIRQKPFLPDRQKNAKDHKRRLLAEKYELRRNLYKALCADPDIPVEMQDQFRYKLSKLPRNSSFVRVRNRCIFTARPRAVYQKFRMSRITFRELASNGQLNGVKKASW